MTRFDETWHRLREWTSGQAPSERMSAQILGSEGFDGIDPSHPLGGRDGGRDAHCIKDGKNWIMGVYFPRGQQSLSEITTKFKGDLASARKHTPGGFVFVTNQELTLSERAGLTKLGGDIDVELYHLERTTYVLDKPAMAPVRKQYLDIDAGPLPIAVELDIDGSARYFTLSEETREKYLEDVSRKQHEDFEKTPPARRPIFGNSDLRLPAQHRYNDSIEPPKPRELERIEKRLNDWAEAVRAKWDESEDYLAAISWAGLRFRIRNVGDVFLNDVQIIITVNDAYGLEWEAQDSFKFGKCIEPFVKPRDVLVPPFAYDNSRLRTADYPVSWTNLDDGKVEITIDLKHLRPHPAWASDDDDLVLFALDETVPFLQAEWTVTAQGYGSFYQGKSIEIPSESVSFLESLSEALKMSDKTT